MIGCADETSSTLRDDLNDSTAWDASSGFHFAPDSPAGGVIVGEYAGDSTLERFCRRDPSILTVYERIADDTIRWPSGDTSTDTDGQDATFAAVDGPVVRGPVVRGDP